MLTRSIFFFAFGLTIMRSFGQEATFKIGQSSDNSYTKGKPAKFQYTNPDGKDENWLAQGFLEIGLKHKWDTKDSKILSADLITELHRNTLIEKEQNVHQFGISIDYKKEYLDTNGTATGMVNPTLAIKYSNNQVKKKESTQVIFGTTIYAVHNSTNASFLEYFVSPGIYLPVLGGGIGFETDHNLGGAYVNEDSNHLAFLQANYEIKGYLLPNFFYGSALANWKTLFYSIDWNGRLVIENQTTNSTKRLIRHGFGVDLSLFNLIQGINASAREDENSISVKYEWVDGANPLKGLEDQSYSQLTINLLVNF